MSLSLVPFLTTSPIQPWLFRVQPYPQESFGHFLGRFRRVNYLSSEQLSALLGQRSYAVAYWETPSRRCQPTPNELRVLSQLTGIKVVQFKEMRSPPATQLHWPTRLCACCYEKTPYHRWNWQLVSQSHCELHQHQLLSACPRCRNAFQLPSYWQSGECDRCYFPFHKMTVFQKGISPSV